jgi:hypothetical protein
MQRADSITDAHHRLVQAIIDERPHELSAYRAASGDDLDERARHVGAVLTAVGTYIDALLDDTDANLAVVKMDTRFIRGRFRDLACEVRGELEDAADRSREAALEAAE